MFNAERTKGLAISYKNVFEEKAISNHRLIDVLCSVNGGCNLTGGALKVSRNTNFPPVFIQFDINTGTNNAMRRCIVPLVKTSVVN